MDTQNETTNTSTNAQPAASPNVPFSKAEFIKNVKKFGEQFGKGANSRPAMAIKAVEAAHRLTDVGPDDAEGFYTLFQKEAAKARGIEYKAESSFKVQVSKLKVFLTLGALPNIDGVQVMEQTVDAITAMAALGENSPLKGSAYDNMTAVARAQLKQPEQQMSKDEIETVLTPEVTERSALDKLISIYKGAYRLFEKEELNGEKYTDMLHAMEDAIVEAGGEVPKPTEKQKAEKALATQLRISAKAKAEAARIASEHGLEQPAA